MKKLSPHSRSLVIMLVIISLSAHSAYAHKSLTDSMKTEIRKVSEAMYTSGNLHYIEADAISDQLIKPNRYYTVRYGTDKILIINNKPVPAALQQQYRDKLQEFLKKNRFGTFAVKSDGLKLADIFNEQSSFRAYSKPQQRGGAAIDDKKSENINKLIALLYADKLIDPNAGYHVKLSPEGLFANGQKLDEQHTQYYLKLLTEADPTITKDHIPYLEVTFTPGAEKKQ